MNTQEAIDAIEEAGYEWREYSGRGMYGKKCIGVVIENKSALWEMAQSLPDFSAPSTDGMGRSLIAYWPSIKIEEMA